MEMENRHMVDKMPEQPLKNEAKDLNEALEAKKEGWEREKQELVREKEQLKVRWRFSQSCCSALQAIVKNELDDKKMVWIVVICMIGVVLKLKSV
jgi:sugar-specific transcriptional regulator TrmB